MNNERIEITILRNFFFNEDFTRKALPFVKSDYFTNRTEKLLYEEVYTFVEKYKNLPTKETILIELNRRKDINDTELQSLKDLLNTLSDEETDLQWLLDTTERFCKDRAVHNAVLSGIKILDGKDKQKQPEAIPSILSEALAVSFDNNIGHDYIGDAENRFEWYHTKEKKYKFDLSFFNRITKGGVPARATFKVLLGMPPFVILLKKDKSNLYLFSLV